MVSTGVSAGMQVLLFLLGVMAFLLQRKLDEEDTRFLVVMGILPTLYVVLMVIHGWEASFLGRTAYLPACFFIFFLLRRVSLNARVVMACTGVGLVVSIPAAVDERLVVNAERIFGVYGGGDYGNMAATYTAAATAGLLLAISSSRDQNRSLAAIGLVIACGFSIVLWSGSRTAVLVSVAGVLVGILASPRNRRQLLVVGLALLITGGAALTTMESSRNRLSLAVAEVNSYSDPSERQAARETSIGLRIDMIRFGIELFKEAPITGIGIPGYRERAREAANSNQISSQIAGFSRGLHNQLVDHLVWGGLMGFVALCTFWVGLFWMALRWAKLSRSPMQHFCAVAFFLVSLSWFILGMLGSLFGSVHGTRHITMLWAVLGALAAPAYFPNLSGAKTICGDHNHPSG
jgi:O-antigen ligase